MHGWAVGGNGARGCRGRWAEGGSREGWGGFGGRAAVVRQVQGKKERGPSVWAARSPARGGGGDRGPPLPR